MTENRRIVLNIAATYGRSLFAMLCGIFCGRWALMALGEVDYGLQGLVGGLTAFIGFFNGILAAAVGRFYALAVGKARVDGKDGLEECRRWFSIALVIHTIIPMVLLLAGWPIGEWAVRHFLTIPPDRVEACLWVFRFSCVACFIGMVSVPFNAFYGAKQLIAELTVYGFATTTLNVIVLYYMIGHSGEWLVPYAAWLTALGIIPSLIITGRAVRLFPECRFSFAYCRDRMRFRQLFAYAGWQFLGSMSVLMRSQGIAILVNKCFGPAFNAALSVAHNVNGKANELGASLLGAFTPAITNAWGAGNRDRAYKLVLKVCKFSVFASLVFVVPLMLELPYVMRLWLKTPPAWVSPLCAAVMLQIIINRTTKGHLVLIQATGRIGVYELFAAGLSLLMLPVAWALIRLGLGPWGLCIAFVSVTAAYAWIRPFFANRIAGLPATPWLQGVFLPLVALAATSALVGLLPRLALPEGLVRLGATLCACEAVLLPLGWAILFDAEERGFVMRKLFGARDARRIRSAYLAHATEGVVRQAGETGGTVTALILHMLKSRRIDGAVVSRYDPRTRRCEAIYSESAEEIASCSGSVYCLTAVVKTVLDHADRNLAVVALGCQAEALARLRAQGRIPSETLIIGLICGGTHQAAYIPAICEANGIAPQAVMGFRFRNKLFGAWPGNTMIRDSSGWHDFPGDARKRLKKAYRLPGCANCQRKMNAEADLVVGDPWGIPVSEAEKSAGLNVVLVRTVLGESVLSEAAGQGRLVLKTANVREIFDGQRVPYRRGLAGRFVP